MTIILATTVPQMEPFRGTARIKAKPGEKLRVFLPVLFVDGELTAIHGVRTYVMDSLAERRALRAAQHYRRKHPKEDVTVVRRMTPNTPAWERAANAEARAFTPKMVECPHCRGPRIQGYVCTRCRIPC